MIDIHSHILPSVDDGASSIDDAIEMIRLSYIDGIKTLVLTPHYIETSKYTMSKEHNEYIFNNLINRIHNEGIDIELILGNEIRVTKNMVGLLDEQVISTIGNTNYVLIETSLSKRYEELDETIYELRLCGYIPIIAHPERCTYIENIVEEVMYWTKLGALIQINRDSILGSNGRLIKKKAKKLLDKNIVHFIASDCHDLKNRKPGLRIVYDYIKRRYNKKLANKIFIENPSKIFENTEVLEPNYDDLRIKNYI